MPRNAMPRSVNRVVAALERARQSLTQSVLTQALADLPPSTTMGEVVASMKEAGFAHTFEGMSLDDFVAAMGGGAPRKRAGNRAAAPAPRRSGGKSAKVNTRTEAGREQFDAAVARALAAAGTAGATELRLEVGGTAAQIRQSLERLMAARKASKRGRKRGTTYSWGSGGATRQAKTKAAGRTKTRAGAKRKSRTRKGKAAAAAS